MALIPFIDAPALLKEVRARSCIPPPQAHAPHPPKHIYINIDISHLTPTI